MKLLALHYIQTTLTAEQMPLLKDLHSYVIETDVELSVA